MLLKRYPEREWRPPEVGRELYTHAVSAHDELKRLKRMGFVESRMDGNDELFRYHPAEPQFDELISELMECYRMYRLKVIDAIFAPSQDALKEFADAFKLRPEADRDET